MLYELVRSSQTLMLPSKPDETRHDRETLAIVSTERREVVPVSCPGKTWTPSNVVLSNRSIVFEGAEADAA
jgi:hypothetical protein